MAGLLVSDTSIIIDLERGGIVPALFRISYEIAVPDVLYERELAPFNGPVLKQLGLKVLSVNEDGVRAAQQYLLHEPRISLIDALSLVLTKETEGALLTGDAALRELAEADGVRCHGLLWVFDCLELGRILNADELHAALDRISKHPRCRLPKNEVAVRLARYSERQSQG